MLFQIIVLRKGKMERYVWWIYEDVEVISRGLF